MKAGRFFKKSGPILTMAQKQGFREYFPKRVYKTERNIAAIVAGTQLCMMLVSACKAGGPFADSVSARYFFMYAMLFTATVSIIPLHVFLVKKKRYNAYLWIRRLYVVILYSWVIGMTLLDKGSGMGIVIYCYMVPTLAAVMLQPPLESLLIFGLSWGALTGMLAFFQTPNFTADLINSTFTTILALFISIRSYQNMAVTYRDGETIAQQYREIEKANAKLNRMACTDQLTGLYNRRYLMEHVLGLYEAYQNSRMQAVFLMIDIDYFKQYNDIYGHLKGDDCLRQVSAVIRKYCQENGMIAVRYGGEEFLALKFFENPEERDRARELQRRIEEAGLPRTDTRNQRVSVSIGVWSGRLQELGSFEAALKFADQALYDAKNAGRDCICHYCGGDVQENS